MSTSPTKDQRETLEAVARVEKGSWEVFSLEGIKECIEQGWVEVVGNRYRLTDAGREVLRRRDPDAAAPISAMTQEWTGCPA